MLAQRNQYIESAYERLQAISQDKAKRLEYEAREKAIMDHNQMMQEAREEGEKRGEERGEKRGEERGREQISRLFALLAQDKRYDVLERAAIDKDFQQLLMNQYGI